MAMIPLILHRGELSSTLRKPARATPAERRRVMSEPQILRLELQSVSVPLSAYSHHVCPLFLICVADVVEILHGPEISFRDRLDVRDLQGSLRLGTADNSVPPDLGLRLGQGKRRLAGVSDLPPVPVGRLIVPPVIVSKDSDAGLVNLQLSPLLPETSLHQPPVEVEDLQCGLAVEFWIV